MASIVLCIQQHHIAILNYLGLAILSYLGLAILNYLGLAILSYLGHYNLAALATKAKLEGY